MSSALPFSMLDVIALLGLPYPQHGRLSYNINCPCCDNRNKKHLNINLQKGVYRCPRCSFAGGILDLYAYYEDVDREEAYQAIMEKLGKNIERKPRQPVSLAPASAPVECPLTDIDARDATYRAFLSKLTLASDHRDNLLSRGLPDAVIEKNQYRTTPMGSFASIAKQLLAEGHYLAGVPGFYRKDGVWTYSGSKRGILIPVRDCFSRIQGLKVRLDNTEKRKFRWISSRDMQDGCGPGAWSHVAGQAQETVVLTEGPLKADIVHYYTGMTLIAVSGVSSLAPINDVLKTMRQRGTKKVMTAFDMDMMTNCYVQKDFGRLTAMLNDMDFKFGTYVWDPRYKGLDDYVWARVKGETA